MFKQLKTFILIIIVTCLGAAATLLAPLILSLVTAFLVGYILYAVFMASNESER